MTLFPLALAVGKLCSNLIRTLGLGQGSNLPGRIARIIDPGIIKRLARLSRYGVLAVSGTNGKSTTCGFAGSILQAANFKAVHNRQGANLVTGVTASLLDACNWRGQIDADYCLFEIDEASLPVVAHETTLAAVVVTNLFRDQLDRFGELDTSARLISEGIRLNSSTAILNADDPNVAQLARGCPRIYFGIESVVTMPHPPTQHQSKSHTSSYAAGVANQRELAYCPSCEHEYVYSLSFFGQLGHYFCPGCGHSRPEPEVKAHDVTLSPMSASFTLELPAESIEIAIPMPGLYNVYNALAAAALAHYLRLPAVIIREGLKNYGTLFGRSEQINIKGKPVLVQLIKNPAGASQVLQSISATYFHSVPGAAMFGSNGSPLLIAINDNLADGRDVSWLWDADFEQLAADSHPVVVSGTRAQDMAVRLKYAGLPTRAIVVEPNLDKALQHALSLTLYDQKLYVLPTYTCLLELQKIFKSMGYLMSGTR